jgi:hypothetical protein
MSDIFISYAAEDRDRVLLLVQALEKTGWTMFWDRTIPAGKTWRQTISAEIQACRSVLVVWTQRSVNSEWVLEEAEIGKRRRILVPVLLDDVEPPLGFGTIQAADLIAWNGDAATPSFHRLISDIAATLGFPTSAETKVGNQRATKGAAEHGTEQARSNEQERGRSSEEARLQVGSQRRTVFHDSKDEHRNPVTTSSSIEEPDDVSNEMLSSGIAKLSNWPIRIAGTFLATLIIAVTILVVLNVTLGWRFKPEEISVIVLFVLVLTLAVSTISSRSKRKRQNARNQRSWQ